MAENRRQMHIAWFAKPHSTIILVHKVSLDTPLAGLVTVDPSVEVIEHDLRLPILDGLNSTIAAVHQLDVEARALPCQGDGRHGNAGQSSPS